MRQGHGEIRADLKSEDPDRRDLGEVKLQELGESARQFICELMTDDDPEVRARASRVAQRLHLFESEADSIFRRLSEKYGSASTIQFSITRSVTENEEPVRVDRFHVTSKLGNLFAVSVEQGSDIRQLSIVGDEIRVALKRDTTLDDSRESHPFADACLRSSFLYAGFAPSLRILTSGDLSDPRQRLLASPLKCDTMPGHPGWRLLSFLLTDSHSGLATMEYIVVDCDKMLVISHRTTGPGVQVVEEYSHQRFDEEVRDEVFRWSTPR